MNRLTTHPYGDVLKEELEARGISQKKFSELINVPYTQLNEILNGKRPVTTDFALMMEAALGINPELLINMQSRYNMSVATTETLLEKLLIIRKACAAVFPNTSAIHRAGWRFCFDKKAPFHRGYIG